MLRSLFASAFFENVTASIATALLLTLVSWILKRGSAIDAWLTRRTPAMRHLLRAVFLKFLPDVNGIVTELVAFLATALWGREPEITELPDLENLLTKSDRARLPPSVVLPPQELPKAPASTPPPPTRKA